MLEMMTLKGAIVLLILLLSATGSFLKDGRLIGLYVAVLAFSINLI